MNKYNIKLIDKCRTVDWRKTLESKGYVYFSTGKYNLNLIGVRAKERDNNEFNDAFIIDYWTGNSRRYTPIYPCTTDPGFKSLEKPVNFKGCAILVPGQYRSCFKKGYHKGQYVALVQHKPVKVFRDANKDFYMDCDESSIEEGMFGINIHKAGEASVIVDGWSAGCQVLARGTDFRELMNIVELSIPIWGSIFTYTLLEEKDLII